MRAVWIVLGLLAVTVALYAGGLPGGRGEASDYTGTITSRTGQPVYLAAPQDVAGIDIDHRILGTSPRSWQARSAIAALHSALDKYHEDFLQEAGPVVILAGDLTLLDVDIGGTVQSPNVVILATGYLLGPFGATDLRNTFHHEYSSVLMRRYAFPREAWHRALPDGFSFPETDAERLAATQVYSDDLVPYHRLGFVSDYGASSFENDVNTYAELLMGNPAGLKELSDQHPLIRLKTKLITAFYIEMHPSFAQRFADVGLSFTSE